MFPHMKSQCSKINRQLPSLRKLSSPILHGFVFLAMLLFGWQFSASAQGIVQENFDSGSLATGPAGWQVRNVLQPLGGYVNDTFPANGSGKALRLQRGSADMTPLGVPQAYGTGRAWLFRTNVYTDFYVAMDLLNWNDATNQAMVLLARATGYDDAPLGIPGLGAVNGYVCNYDNLQDGQTAGDRLGGEFQINVVTSEDPNPTICASEVTLTPGHTYRMIFKGSGFTLTGQLYDIEDLTSPIATMTAADPTTSWTSGVSGIVTFNREDSVHPNQTDETVDNYYSAPSDPNADIAPAIRHPIPGTPQVVTRNPVKRFTNFHLAASGISFTARTFTAGQIKANATKLYLNGVDVSASLAPFPADVSTLSFSTAAGTLEPNKNYAARIELQDTTGTLKSTNTFWFDTFSDAYVATLKTVEAEDYNYSNGLYQLDPIPVSGLDMTEAVVNGNGVGYYGLFGTQEVDYHKPGGSYHWEFSEYRTDGGAPPDAVDRVQITQGSGTARISANRDEAGDILDDTHVLLAGRIYDTQRAKYAAKNMQEYQVRLTSPGDWMNYTRVFQPTNYHVYLRCGSFGPTTVFLDRVTSDPKATNQTTARLGTFNVGNHIMRLNYTYEPLMAGASPAVLTLSDTNTLRLTLGGTVTKEERLISMDYLMFEPTSDSPTVFDNFNDGNDTAPLALWSHYDPIGGLTAAPATFSFPGGNSYRIQAPAPAAPDAGQARAGSVVPGVYSDFCVMADIVAWDDSLHQVCGVMARVETPGLGTTTGYLFTHDRGNPTSSTAGDMDIVLVEGEIPISLPTAPSGGDSLHLTPGKTYRLVFTGVADQFRGRVYELPNLSAPVVDITASDATHASGVAGLLVADNSGTYDQPADVTFDNFLATTAAPEIAISQAGGSVTLSWPLIPFRLQSAATPDASTWTTITSGITQVGGQNVYALPASGMQCYRLVYP